MFVDMFIDINPTTTKKQCVEMSNITRNSSNINTAIWSYSIIGTSCIKCVLVSYTNNISIIRCIILFFIIITVSQSLTSQKKNRQEKKFIKARNKCTEINSAEQHLKIQHIKRIIDEERKLAEIKLQKENNLLIHDRLVQKLTIEHIKQIHELELHEAQAKRGCKEKTKKICNNVFLLK